MSSPPMFRTCPLLISAIASKPANVRSAVLQATKAEPRPDQPFDPPVILFNDVVEVFALPQSREAPQFTVPLHLARRSQAGLLSTVIVRGLTVWKKPILYPT